MAAVKEKKERSLGVHLHLKGYRCQSPKCAFERRPYKPGVHGPRARRKNMSDFGRQLKEKQKFKLTYGLDEKNLRLTYEAASKKQGDVARKFLELLERRLDNVVYRLGFAPSRSSARQSVLHGHIVVGKKRVRSPGYQVKNGEMIALQPKSLALGQFKELKTALAKQELPVWLKLDLDKMQGHVLALPQEFETPFEVNLLVESFSK